MNPITNSNISQKINVLYIDDEENNLNAFKAVFRREFNVFVAESAKEGLKIIDENEIEVILSDQRMPEMTGVEFFESILENHADAMRILVTGYSDINTVIEAINKGQVYRYVAKPWCNDDLSILIKQAYEVYRLRKENKELTATLLRVNQQLEFMLRQKLSSL
ncbi:MAG: response regulator [Flavobacteriales bacterium]|nr:response regulator [Flavobacteriales bacterium]